jgi:long-chain acyl-CoA synthetase
MNRVTLQERTRRMTDMDLVAPGPTDEPYRHLADMVDQVCERYQSHEAFTAVLPNGMFGKLSFERVQQLSDQFAAFLREQLGLQPGDRVALQLPNTLAMPICAFGVFKAGCVLVNTNPLYTAAEMIHQFNDSGARALVVIDLFGDKLAEVVPQTAIEHVVVARVTDFFPALPGFVAYNVMKYWNRMIPVCSVPAVTLRDALQQGNAAIETRAIQVADYTAEIQPTDLAVLQYTGGTTGVSKGAMLSHANLLANMLQIDEQVRERVAYGKECVLAVLPLYHIFAFTVNLLFFFHAGSRNVLVANPRPLTNLQRAIENYPISWIPGVNTLFNGLLNEEWFSDYPPPHLRGAVAGGAALQRAVAERWEAITNSPIIEGYGLTEASPVVCFNPLGANKPGSIGLPVRDTEVSLLNDLGEPALPGEAGELAVRGPQVMQGYWQRPEETARVLRNGWLLTGDIAAFDDDGFLRIVDRKKDMVLVSGFNVFPNEVEDCLARFEGVDEVAVIGVPDPLSGEAVRAYVTPRSGVTLEVEQLRVHCKRYLAPYKVPRQFEVRSELPRSNVGKVLRRVLRDEALAAMEVQRG